MGEKCFIEWTDSSWNPLRGCRRISPGCENCYAERIAARFSDPGLPYNGFAKRTESGPRWTGKVEVVPHHLRDPIKWQKARKIFVCSTSDLFYEEIGVDVIQSIFSVIFEAKRHTYQILTKRAERMSQVLRHIRFPGGFKWEDAPEPNVWVGVSVEDQKRAEDRIPRLLETPAAIRFLSVEPLLGPVDLLQWLKPKGRSPGIDWVIIGAESGPNARPMEMDWVRTIREQCVEAGVALFFKQAVIDGEVVSLPMLDGASWSQFPKNAEGRLVV